MADAVEYAWEKTAFEVAAAVPRVEPQPWKAKRLVLDQATLNHPKCPVRINEDPDFVPPVVKEKWEKVRKRKNDSHYFANFFKKK